MELERPRPSAAITFRDLGDELMFYDGAGDRVHILNGTARQIFRLCDGQRTVEGIVDEIVTRFAIDAETARTDVRETVDRLLGLGILEA